MADRDIGGMGESEFGRLCSSVSLTHNLVQKDRTGWDYSIEFPLPRLPGHPADMAPPALECRIQVKATDRHRRKWDIALRNLERLAKSPVPAFICLFEFNGAERAQHVYLVHIGKEVVARTLKRLRQLENGPRDATRRPTLSITCDDSHRLPEPTGECLKRAIEGYVSDGFEKYCKWKSRLLKTLGYESGYGYVNMNMLGCDPMQDLIDASLGLRESVKVDGVSWHDTRFDVDCQLPLPSGPAELSLAPAPVKGTVTFRERKSSPGVEFHGDVYAPSVNRILPRERVSFRIQAKLFGVIFQPHGHKGQFTLVPEVTAVPVSLGEAKRFLLLMCMLKAHGSEGVWMEVAVESQGLAGGQLLVRQTHDCSQELATLEQALAVARVYGIEDKVAISINDVMGRSEPIAAFHKVINGQTEGTTVTFSVAEDLADIRGIGGIVFAGQLCLSGYLLHCVVGMAGSLERIGEKQYELASQDRCLYRCAKTKQDQEIDKEELRSLYAEIKAEMEAKGVSPLIILNER
ncbi:MAG: hypothetical protein JW955_25785 [Sedimentisphaerales bacterium]|nr:hypothetical protein [Sedimentisphaerales bacterium]